MLPSLVRIGLALCEETVTLAGGGSITARNAAGGGLAEGIALPRTGEGEAGLDRGCFSG